MKSDRPCEPLQLACFKCSTPVTWFGCVTRHARVAYCLPCGSEVLNRAFGDPPCREARREAYSMEYRAPDFHHSLCPMSPGFA